MKREPQKPESLSHVAEVFTDRIRVPWLWGGARKVDLSIIPPLILLPVLLHLAAFHFLLGMAILIALPGLVLWYYYFTHLKKGQTLFFLSLVCKLFHGHGSLVLPSVLTVNMNNATVST